MLGYNLNLCLKFSDLVVFHVKYSFNSIPFGSRSDYQPAPVPPDLFSLDSFERNRVI